MGKVGDVISGLSKIVWNVGNFIKIGDISLRIVLIF